MENKTSCLRAEFITLPSQVETTLEQIYKKHHLPPIINDVTRRRLSSISEELALVTLGKVLSSRQPVKTLDGFIKYLVDQATGASSGRSSPAQSPYSSAHRVLPEEMSVEAPLKRDVNGGSMHSPQLLALGELDFKKAFLLLSYIPGKSLAEVVTADQIRLWKDLPMVAFEAAVWDRLGQHYSSKKDGRVSLKWDSGKTHYYQCHVAVDGTYTFKGPLLENTSTHLHKILGDDNVLTVKFEDVQKNSPNITYKGIAKNGIMIGLRRYQFFVFKDGGKEEKKKDFSTNGVKCYFIRTDSAASIDMGIQ